VTFEKAQKLILSITFRAPERGQLSFQVYARHFEIIRAGSSLAFLASRNFHNELWPLFASEQFARRRTYDLRLARSLVVQGVTDFATVNLKDFSDAGFKRVFNPLAG